MARKRVPTSKPPTKPAWDGVKGRWVTREPRGEFKDAAPKSRVWCEVSAQYVRRSDVWKSERAEHTVRRVYARPQFAPTWDDECGGWITRANKRRPANVKEWSPTLAGWVLSKPRGRPPHNKTWDARRGWIWDVPDEERPDSQKWDDQTGEWITYQAALAISAAGRSRLAAADEKAKKPSEKKSTPKHKKKQKIKKRARPSSVSDDEGAPRSLSANASPVQSAKKKAKVRPGKAQKKVSPAKLALTTLSAPAAKPAAKAAAPRERAASRKSSGASAKAVPRRMPALALPAAAAEPTVADGRAAAQFAAIYVVAAAQLFGAEVLT